MTRHARLWWRLASMSLMRQMGSRLASLGFLAGKAIRLGFFAVFMAAVFDHAPDVAGYSLTETLVFFLTFNLVDSLIDFLLRGMWGARAIVVTGELDHWLAQPASPLFRLAFQGTDFLDLLMLGPIALALVLAVKALPGVGPAELLVFAVLVVNGVLLSFAIHVFVAALCVATEDLESTLLVHHELMTLGRFPADIYPGPLRWALTFIAPITVMFSYPVYALLGRLDAAHLAGALVLGAGAVSLSLLAWSRALRRYTSASS